MRVAGAAGEAIGWLADNPLLAQLRVSREFCVVTLQSSNTLPSLAGEPIEGRENRPGRGICSAPFVHEERASASAAGDGSRHCLGVVARLLRAGALPALIWATCLAASYAPAATINQVVFFTGFLAIPDTGTGMDILKAELAEQGVPDYEGQVFAWNDQQSAHQWVHQLQDDRLSLVLIGHSFGGNAALQLARDFLVAEGTDVDLTIQIDSVANFGSGGNDQLPGNVEVGINYYQIATGLLEPQGESSVQGATNVNIEVLLNDSSISHTSIDNDPRLHELIVQHVLDNLNFEEADFNSDGVVGGADYLIWQRGLGAPAPATVSQGDANGDATVDGDDLTIWLQQFGKGVAYQATRAKSVPEPRTLLLAVLGQLLYGLHSRRERFP